MTVSWLEAIGYCGTLATFVSYSMRTIIPLRIASIMSSVFFIAYAGIAVVWPMLATELMLLPLNCVRLVQDLRRSSAETAIVGTATSLER
ncbi:MAG TPA: cyclic nucleotide-binding protein [Hyphomicrobiaceae bacterium]|nr:cyclic nucleotide-binding protein [Hyphomicrobiaceae bacterium]